MNSLSIPHDVFENQIKNLGFITVSEMSFLRTGIQNTEYGGTETIDPQNFAVIPTETSANVSGKEQLSDDSSSEIFPLDL